jgi:Negative regulator of sigma F
MDTNQLIRILADDVRPVRRLPHPMARAAVWFAISVPYVVAIVAAYEWAGYAATLPIDWPFLIEELATVATAVTAAIAAFCCIVPGRDRRIAFLPIVPLAVWLASLGRECAAEWLRVGANSLSFRVGWECLPPAALIGVVPAIVLVAMLRRGAPLYPRSTVMLGALAVAALGNLALRIFHEGDVTIMMLVWHLGAVALLLGVASLFGPRMLSWRRGRQNGTSFA